MCYVLEHIIIPNTTQTIFFKHNNTLLYNDTMSTM